MAKTQVKIVKFALIAATAGLSACAPRVVNCNREAQWWASGADGKINTQIKVCFRDDGSLGYRAEPFVPPPPQPEAPKAADPVAVVKKIVDELQAEIEALKAPPRAAAPESPKVSDEAMAAKRAAASKLKP